VKRLHRYVKSKIEEIKVTKPERAIQIVKDTFGKKSLVTFVCKVQELCNSTKIRDETVQQFAI
jgi:hypothetical protein